MLAARDTTRTHHCYGAALLAGVITLLTTHAAAQGTLLTLQDWGTYAAHAVTDTANPQSNAGVTTITSNEVLLEKTHHICAKLGTMFGIRYRLSDTIPTPTPLSIEIEHPALLNLHNQQQTRDNLNTVLEPGELHYSGWAFRDPKKLIPGQWRFIIRQGSDTLLDEKFDVKFSCGAAIV